MDLPIEVQEFVDNLVPTDVGKDTVGDYIIHYEGFTDECNDGHDDVSIDSEYAEVYQDFDDRQGKEALIRGVANEELGCENNPVLYSVYKNINENKDKIKTILVSTRCTDILSKWEHKNSLVNNYVADNPLTEEASQEPRKLLEKGLLWV